ncbi:MAG: rhamnulokinase [Clostridiales bacterium]|nr:rhamnulokinase [Clostridiales bacterium]
MKKYLAIDLGASSGRGILGTIENNKLILKEMHRFSNDPVETPSGFFWDTLRLLYEIKTAIAKCGREGGLDSIGIDTWGVDYGYIDASGAMLSPSYQYRDLRTAPMIEEVYGKIPYDALYKITGIESMSFNTVFQLAADLKNRPWLSETAEKLLLTPDLLNYFLTGKMAAEYTIASTTALMSAAAREYDANVLGTLGIPKNLFPDVVMPGNILGSLHEKIDSDTGNTGASVVNICSHDTASAILAVPAKGEDFLYISSGTWSLMGIESNAPLITPLSQKYSFTNEGGAFGKINVMKNIMGLWLIQESRRQWKREGKEYSFDEMSDAALAAAPFRSLIDPDNPVFSPAGDIPGRIQEYCRETGQPVPEDMGAVVRCIFESLTLRYRWTAEKLEELSGKKYNTINIVGGGTKDTLLCRFAANGTGRTVHAGPIEATAIGNIMMQAYAAGEVSSCEEIRKIVRSSFDVKIYEPDLSESAQWEEAYTRFCALIAK